MKAIEIGGEKIGYAFVDDEDYKKINKYHWWLHNGYAETKIKGKNIYMHRMIMKAKPGEIIDHRNHQKLDNRKENLRRTDIQGNSFNRPIKTMENITKTKDGKYRVSLYLNRKKYDLGTFSNLSDALEVHDYYHQLRDYIHHVSFE